LIPQIKKILPPHIHIIDSGEAVAKQTQNILRDKVGFSSETKKTPIFYTNTNSKVLSEILGGNYLVEEIDF
jgi:glutamate racemase